MSMVEPRYRRVLLKLSGEALMGRAPTGIDLAVVQQIGAQVRRVVEHGIQVAIVIGGGNIWRGLAAASQGMDRSTADYIGMLGTVMNALALQNALEQGGQVTRVQSAIQMQQVCEPYIWRRAIRHMEKGRVVILAAGTGNPYFSTDSAAALRAAELRCDIILMGKNRVDGVYDADPNLNPDARRFERLTHQEALERNLRVMDAAALALCMENGLPIVVFNAQGADHIVRAALGDSAVGTLVDSGLETVLATP
jgi:uridylate kinase